MNSAWANLSKDVAESENLNMNVTLVEVQAPNAAAGYLYEAINSSKEDLKNRLVLKIDKEKADAAARAAKTARSAVERKALTAYAAACDSLAELIDLEAAGTASFARRLTSFNLVEDANQAAMDAFDEDGEDYYFEDVVFDEFEAAEIFYDCD